MWDSGTGRAWVELDWGALERNVRFLRGRLPPSCALMPAVKANAYGHGAVPVCRKLNELGVGAFCVASVQEGVDLRQNGVRGEILILGYTHPPLFPLLERFQLTQTIVDRAYAHALNDFGAPLHVHIGVDTGMRRLGEPAEHFDAICGMFSLPHLIVDGLFTHLAVSDESGPESRAFTLRQAGAFYALAGRLRSRGRPPPRLHLLASYGALRYPELAGDLARVGIALYGVLSTGEDARRYGRDLTPVLSLKARVASVRPLRAGESAGYGRAFTAVRDMAVAALTIGYADGLPRALSNGAGEALVRGRRAPILGRVCMDQTLVDVSGIPGVRAGDEAVLIGSSGNEHISAADLARQAGTITNEILSRLGPRLARVAKA